MTQVVIKTKQYDIRDLPMREWFIVKHKKSGDIEIVVRNGFECQGCDDPVLYIRDEGIEYDDYSDFVYLYEIIGPVNKIEVG
jgi:hypothetical protein